MNLCFNIILFTLRLFVTVNIWDILYETLSIPPSETRRPPISSFHWGVLMTS